MVVSSGMTGELYPRTNPKLMGPRTDAKVARYNFLFFTLLRGERGKEQIEKGKGQIRASIVCTFTQPTLLRQRVRLD